MQSIKKVIVVTAFDPAELEKKINQLCTLGEVKDIKYSTDFVDGSGIIYSAIICYTGMYIK